MERKPVYYLVPALLAFIMLGSNFLGTDIFQSDVNSFSVWFTMSLFSFVCGWLINKTLGWKHGGKVVFATSIAGVFISLIMVSLFNSYFGIDRLLTENLVLYSLRTIMLGAMGFFGMTVSETLLLQNKVSSLESKGFNDETQESDIKKKSILLVKEAQLNADRILFEAKKNARESEEKFKVFESRLRELIQMEKEIIRQYEQEDKDNS
ncbi:MAG: hypothetical protein JW995_06570 [Melioribacteraceae bacterium]|nr:hypothetical protein [Melioribacteraceae bacterium]